MENYGANLLLFSTNCAILVKKKEIIMEAQILLWIQENLRADWLDPIVVFITTLGNEGWLWILLSAIFLCVPKWRKMGCCTSCALIFDLFAVNIFIKNIVARPRPYTVIEELISVIGPQSEYSFPSGHTAGSFAFAIAFALMTPKKVSVPVIILASLISLSRLYVGVHYPTDILGGLMIGSLCGIAGVAFVKWLYKKFENKKKKTA